MHIFKTNSYYVSSFRQVSIVSILQTTTSSWRNGRRERISKRPFKECCTTVPISEGSIVFLRRTTTFR